MSFGIELGANNFSRTTHLSGIIQTQPKKFVQNENKNDDARVEAMSQDRAQFNRAT